MKLEEILYLSQSRLKKKLYRELRSMAYRPMSRKGFLYAQGVIPVLLIAHLDTVHNSNVKTICRSDCGDILMSPQGIGGDDRAGVYMILEILKTHKCHVLFCEDEECGAVGAHMFVCSGIRPDVNYIIELDRKGATDAVFYECDNDGFSKFILSFGFVEADGSFSDISVLAPALKIAAVNLSAGYFNAHTIGESIDLSIVRTNIEKIRNMLDTPSPFFKYIRKRVPHVYRGRDFFASQRHMQFYGEYPDSAIKKRNCKYNMHDDESE